MKKIAIAACLVVVSGCSARMESRSAPAAANPGPAAMASSFSLGGTVSGLLRPGLVLELNGAGDLPIAGDGPFEFPSSLATGMTYDIRAAQQPPGETCSVSNGAGTMGAADLANIAVVCAPLSYTVGGSVAGLRGTLVLQDNGGDDLTLTSDGDFQFATPIASGASYAVSIVQQPTGPNQTCVVANGADKVVAANVSGISIVCTTATYFVNVVVSGVQGSGLVLQDNGGDDLPIASDGSYVFATPIEDGQAYNVLVATQPSSPDQTCTADPGGTINGGDVTVNVTCQ